MDPRNNSQKGGDKLEVAPCFSSDLEKDDLISAIWGDVKRAPL